MSGTVIVGAQWGDEGKGKIVDLLADRFEIVARYQGGIERRPHRRRRRRDVQVPAAAVGHPRPRQALRARQRRRHRPGQVLCGELNELESRGRSTSGLRISGNAHLVMPWHRHARRAVRGAPRAAADRHHQARHRAGLRRQGVAHRHPRAGPARPRTSCAEKVAAALALKNEQLERIYGLEPLDGAELVADLDRFAHRLEPYIADTAQLLDDALARRPGRAVRGRPGHHARPRPRHVPVRHVVQPGGRRRLHGQRHRADA